MKLGRPHHDNGQGIKCNCYFVHVHPYVGLFVHQYVTPLSNSFDQNFCALSLIILFYICACCDTRFKNVCLFLFVEVKALLGLCYMLYNIQHKIKFLCLWNLVTLLHPYVRLFVHQYGTPLSNNFDQNFMELGHIV